MISFLFGIFKRSALQKKEKWYLGYLGYVLCIELIVKLLIFVFDVKSTHYLYPFYISGEFLLLSFVFIIELNFSRKWYILSAIISAIIFIKTALVVNNNLDIINNIGKIFSHLSIICLAGCSLIKELKNLKAGNNFLIIYACLFMYYSISLFFFLLLNQFTTISNSGAAIIWGMNNVLSSILYGASIYVFMLSKK
ncbi:MAG: hypothetical protein V4663_11700 [Bacteroidota bacterium]